MNIFARELVVILGSRGKELGSLYTLKVSHPRYGDPVRITQGAVTRLKRSLTEPITATLNPAQLDALEQAYQLSPAELERLRAALLAEVDRSLLMGRIALDEAQALGDAAFRLLSDGSLAGMQEAWATLVNGSRDLSPQLLRRSATRGAPTPVGGGPTGEDAALQALDQARELFEQGQLWLAVARDTRDTGARQGYLALARALLGQAHEQTRLSSRVAQGSAAQRELLTLIGDAQAESSQVL